MTAEIKLYQIQYDDFTGAKSDSGILNFDCRANIEKNRREIAHLIRFYDEVVSKEPTGAGTYYALLSPKFCKKSGLSFADIKSFIGAAPQTDVYLFNVFPIFTYTFNNVWEQGLFGHGDELLRLANALFKAAAIDFDVTKPHRNSDATAVYCNYWVATKAFFDEFMPFVKRLDAAINKLDPHDREQLFSPARYASDACFYPFVFERIISVFLLTNAKFTTTAYLYPNKTKGVKRNYFIKNWRQQFIAWEQKQTQPEKIFEVVSELYKLHNPIAIKSNHVFIRVYSSLLKRVNILKIRSLMVKLTRSL